MESPVTPSPTGGLSKRTKIILIASIIILIIGAVIFVYMRKKKQREAAQKKGVVRRISPAGIKPAVKGPTITKKVA